MKITFKANTIGEVLDQMQDMLNGFSGPNAVQGPAPDVFVDMGLNPVETPVVKPVANPVEKPEAKPGKTRSPKQLENDERLRKLAVEKAAAKKAPVTDEPEPAPKAAAAAPVDPADLVKIRIRTIAELQEAYANGQQKEVFELLSKYGKGAKSFRELPAEAFAPIREAIDAGALS